MANSRRDSIRVGPAKPRASRAWAPRTRSGCKTCRTRRVKCDEARPGCRRCSLVGRQCEGYETETSDGVMIKIEPSERPAPLGLDSTRQELRIFDLFRKEIVLNLSEEFDLTFWNVQILQATRLYPPIWHGCLALAAIHKRQKIPFSQTHNMEQRDGLYVFAIRQCNLAMRHVSEALERGVKSRADIESLLLSCMLFGGISSILGDFRQAIMHINAMVQLHKLLQPYEQTILAPQKANQNSVFNANTLNVLVVRAEIPLLTWMTPDNNIQSWSCKLTQPRCSLFPYKNWTEAHLEMQWLARFLMHKDGLVGTLCSPQRKKSDILPFEDFEREMVMCRQKFNVLKENSLVAHGTLDPGIALAELGWITIYTCFQKMADAVNGQTRDYTVQLEYIIDTIERILLAEATEPEAKRQDSPVFSFTSMTGDLLVFVGFESRRHDFRQRAVNLLRNSPRRDALYDLRMVASMCDAKAVLEQSGAATDGTSCECDESNQHICLDHRVAKVVLRFAKDGSPTLLLDTYKALRLGQPSTEMPLSL